MKGNEYRDLIAGYIFRNFGDYDLQVYTEVGVGKTITGKDRQVDVFVLNRRDQRAIAIECKYQNAPGTTDEKIPYALEDLAAMRIPGCLAYAGSGWSRGILHTLEASPLAASCLPDPQGYHRSKSTRELDHVLAATFGLWAQIIPKQRLFTPPE